MSSSHNETKRIDSPLIVHSSTGERGSSFAVPGHQLLECVSSGIVRLQGKLLNNTIHDNLNIGDVEVFKVGTKNGILFESCVFLINWNGGKPIGGAVVKEGVSHTSGGVSASAPTAKS